MKRVNTEWYVIKERVAYFLLLFGNDSFDSTSIVLCWNIASVFFVHVVCGMLDVSNKWQLSLPATKLLFIFVSLYFSLVHVVTMNLFFTTTAFLHAYNSEFFSCRIRMKIWMNVWMLEQFLYHFLSHQCKVESLCTWFVECIFWPKAFSSFFGKYPKYSTVIIQEVCE